MQGKGKYISHSGKMIMAAFKVCSLLNLAAFGASRIWEL